MPLYVINEGADERELSYLPVVGTRKTAGSTMCTRVILELILPQEGLCTRKPSVAGTPDGGHGCTNSVLCNGTAVNQSVAEGAQSCVPID